MAARLNSNTVRLHLHVILFLSDAFTVCLTCIRTICTVFLRVLFGYCIHRGSLTTNVYFFDAIISELFVCALVVFRVFENHFATKFLKNPLICF